MAKLEEPNVAFPAAVAAAEAVIDHVDELSNLVGRKVENWNGFPGKVDEFFARNQEFQLRHCDAENPGKRAKKLMKVTHQELLDLLIGDDDGVFDDEVIPEEEEVLLEETEEAEAPAAASAIAASLPP